MTPSEVSEASHAVVATNVTRRILQFCPGRLDLMRFVKLGILLLLLIGLEVVAESSFGNMLGPLGVFFNALGGGLLLILTDLKGLAIIPVSFMIGMPLFMLMRRFIKSRYLLWASTGASVVSISFLLRMALAVGIVGNPGMMPGIAIMAASGAVSGSILSVSLHEDLSDAYRAILGLGLGAIYHFELATTWTTRVPGGAGLPLTLLEFFAPAAFGLLFGVWLRRQSVCA